MANARDLQISAYLTRAAAESVLSGDPRSGQGWRSNLIDSPIYDTTFGADFAKLDDSSQSRTDAALQVLAAVEDFMVHLQSVDCPTDGVTLVVTPRTFHDIRALGVARASSELSGGSGRPMFGGVADAGGLGAQLGQGLNGLGDTLEYMGCTIVKSNHLINFDASADAIGEGRYNIDGATAKVKGLLFQRGGVASISKTGLKVDTVDDIRRNTVFTVASMLSGTGVLRPELCSVIVGGDAALGGGTPSDPISKAELRTALSMSSAEFVNTQ